MDIDVEKARKATSGIDDRISDAEGELLYNLAKNVPEGQVIVEIGKGNGESTVWLAKGSVDGKMNKIYNIKPCLGESQDIESNRDEGNSDFVTGLEKAGAYSVVDGSYKDSEDTSRKWKDKVGLLCIDTLDEYADMKEALRSWECHLSTNARVVLHGCEKPGPARIIKEYLGSLGDFIYEQRVGALMVMMVDECIHHWVIDANEIGVCRSCGRTRNFKRIRREADTAGIRRRQATKVKNRENRIKLKKK